MVRSPTGWRPTCPRGASRLRGAGTPTPAAWERGTGRVACRTMLEPLDVLHEAHGLHGIPASRRAGGRLRRLPGLPAAAALRELRLHARRRRRDSGRSGLDQADQRQERPRPLRHGAPAGMRRLPRHGRLDLPWLLGGALDAGEHLSACRRAVRRAATRPRSGGGTRARGRNPQRQPRPRLSGPRGGCARLHDAERCRASHGRVACSFDRGRSGRRRST